MVHPFQVFILGLLTVFLVLLVVVATGNVIIWFVNRFYYTGPTAAVKETDPAVVAAITSVIQKVTRGSGRVEKIEKC